MTDAPPPPPPPGGIAAPPPPPPPQEFVSAPVAAPPRRRRTGLVVGLVAGGVVLLAGGGAAGAVFVGGLGTSSSAAGYDPANGLAQASSAPSVSSSEATQSASPVASAAPSAASVPSSSPSATTLTQQQATDQLDALAASGDASTSFDGRWIAQVASKSAGISDPLETTASGSHVFQPTDILAEIAGLRQRVGDPSRLVTVLSTQFSANWKTSGGTPYWVTVYDGGFGSKADAAAWCASTFADLSSAQRADACLPKTLTRG